MIKFCWGKTFPTLSLFNTNGKGDGKQTTQPPIAKQAPVPLRSSALYQWCLVFNGLEKTSSTKFYHDLDLARQVRRGSTQHWQVCLEFSGTRESLWAAERKSWTFEASSTAGNTQHVADPVREPQQVSTLSAMMWVEFSYSLLSFSRESVFPVWKIPFNFNHNQPSTQR